MKRFLAILLAMLLLLVGCAYADDDYESDDYESDDPPNAIDMYLGGEENSGNLWTYTIDDPTIAYVDDNGFVATDNSPAPVPISNTYSFRINGIKSGAACITFRYGPKDGEPLKIVQYNVLVDDDTDVTLYNAIIK